MKTVVVVSASWCPQCGPYKKMLQSAGIAFQEFDADSPLNQEFLLSLGVRGLPTTFIYEGKEIVATVTGNNAKKVQELLGV